MQYSQGQASYTGTFNGSKEERSRNASSRIISDLSITKPCLEVYNRMLEKAINIKNPEVRYSLIVCLFDMMLDIILSVVEAKSTYNIDDLLPEDQIHVNKYQTEVRDTLCSIRKNSDSMFDLMREWILTPSLNPDCPYGNKVMKDSQVDLLTVSKT